MAVRRRAGLEARLAAISLLAVVISGGLIVANIRVRTRADVEEMRRESIENNIDEATALVDDLTSSLERQVLNVARSGEALYRVRQASNARGSQLGADEWQEQVATYLTSNAAAFPTAFGNGLWFEPNLWDPAQRHSGYYAQINDDGNAEFTLIYDTPEYDYLSQDWYALALPPDWDRRQRRPHDLYWTPSYFDTTGGQKFQTVAAVMYDGDRIIGVATTDWTLREMQDVLARLQPTEHARAFLVDPLSSRLVVGLDGERDVALAQHPLAADVDLDQPAGSRRERATTMGDEEARTFTSRTRSGLILGVVVPEGDILQPVEDLQGQVLFFIALGLIGGLLVGALAVHRLLRPLAHLTRGVDRVADGDLEASVPASGSGELRTLSDSFNRMTTELRMLRRCQGDHVDELELAGDKLLELATHDQLTGLATRTVFSNRLEARLASVRVDAPFAVLFIDCDRFKMVNDSLGHLRGDQVLVEIAGRLTSALGERGLIARFGGDEFVAIVEGVHDQIEIEALAQQVLEHIAEPCTVENSTFVVTISIGAVLVDGHQRDPHEILRDADVAMYRAKSGGRNRVVLFEQWMAEEVGAMVELENELRHAVEHGEFEVAFQPIVALASGRLLGFEALARWRHPTGDLLAPTGFITAAEESGLIVGLGQQILEMACADAASWCDDRLFVAVNVSRRQLAEPHLVGDTLETIAASGLDPQRVHIELTESLAMEDLLVESGIVQELRATGVHISIDDFGTGYSSLAVLHTLPLDVLKIDRAFVEAADAPHREEILRAVISLSHGLGVMSVAEGVETVQQYDLLRSLGCDAAQGYLIAEPMLDGVDAFIRSYNPAAPVTGHGSRVTGGW